MANTPDIPITLIPLSPAGEDENDVQTSPIQGAWQLQAWKVKAEFRACSSTHSFLRLRAKPTFSGPARHGLSQYFFNLLNTKDIDES